MPLLLQSLPHQKQKQRIAFAVLNDVLEVGSDLRTGFFLACNVGEHWYDTQKASSSKECSPQGVPEGKMMNS